MPDERTVLATLGTLGERIAEAGVRPPAIIVVGDVVAVARPDAFAGELMADVIEVDDPDDPRLADYRDLRDVQLRKPPRERRGAVPGRGREGRTPRARGRPRRPLLPDGAALARRPRRRARPQRRALLRRPRGDGRGGHRLPRPPGRARLAPPAAAAGRRRGARGRPVGARPRGPGRPHQRRGGLPVGSRARASTRCCWLPRCADPLYRRAVKVAHGCGLRAAVDPARRVARRAAGRCRGAASRPWR